MSKCPLSKVSFPWLNLWKYFFSKNVLYWIIWLETMFQVFMELESGSFKEVDIFIIWLPQVLDTLIISPKPYCFMYVIWSIWDLSSQGLLCTPRFSLRTKQHRAGSALALCLVQGGLCNCLSSDISITHVCRVFPIPQRWTEDGKWGVNMEAHRQWSGLVFRAVDRNIWVKKVRQGPSQWGVTALLWAWCPEVPLHSFLKVLSWVVIFLPLTQMYQRLPLAYSQQVVTALSFVATATIQEACDVLWCPGFRTPFQSVMIVACQVYHWSSQWLPALAPLWSGGNCTAQRSPDNPALGVHSCRGYTITRKSHKGHSLSTLRLWPRAQPFTISFLIAVSKQGTVFTSRLILPPLAFMTPSMGFPGHEYIP